MAQFQIECVESKTEPNQSQYSKFILEPLDRGQGTTIGNALRRVLLSNLEGTAITAVRVAGLIRDEKTGEKKTRYGQSRVRYTSRRAPRCVRTPAEYERDRAQKLHISTSNRAAECHGSGGSNRC